MPSRNAPTPVLRQKTGMTEPARSRRLIRPIVFTLAGIAMAAAMLWYLMTPDAIAALRLAATSASPGWLLLSWMLMPVVQTARAYRFGVLLFGESAPRAGLRPRPGLWAVTTTLLAINTILPFKLGEVSFPVMTRRLYAVPLADGAGVIVFARLLDLATTLTLLGAATILAGIDTGLGIPRWLSLAAIALTAGASLSPFALVPGAGNRTARSSKRAQPRARLSRIGADLIRLRLRITSIRAATVIVVSSYAVWGCHALAAMFAVKAVSAALTHPIENATAAAAGLIANIAFALPVTGVAGLGAPQAAFVMQMRLAAAPMPDAVVGAFAYTAVTLSATVVLGALGAGLFAARLANTPGRNGDPGREQQREID